MIMKWFSKAQWAKNQKKSAILFREAALQCEYFWFQK